MFLRNKVIGSDNYASSHARLTKDENIQVTTPDFCTFIDVHGTDALEGSFSVPFYPSQLFFASEGLINQTQYFSTAMWILQTNSWKYGAVGNWNYSNPSTFHALSSIRYSGTTDSNGNYVFNYTARNGYESYRGNYLLVLAWK